MVAWPANFVILRDNFQETLGDRTITSNMDVGPAKKRRRTVLVSENVVFSLMLTQELYEQFKEFYYNNDTGVFDFVRPDNNELKQARFASTPSPILNETLWVVTVQLELLP